MKATATAKKLSEKKFWGIYTSSQRAYHQIDPLWHIELYVLYLKNKFDELFRHFGSTGQFSLFLAIHDELDGIDYFRILGEVLKMETYASDEKNIIWYLVNNPKHDRCLRCELMNDEEKKVYSDLPESGIIYRGTKEGMESGFSWTLDKEMALFFARRHPGGIVLKATYRKQDIAAYFGRESEIFIHPSHVINQVVEGKVEGTILEEPDRTQLVYNRALNYVRGLDVYSRLKRTADRFCSEFELVDKAIAAHVS